MSVVTSIIKNGIEYTKNGCRLLSKTTKTVDVPCGVAASTKMKLDTVVIETDFGKTIKTIESMKAQDGKPLQKIITETRDGEVIEKLVRDYTYDRSIKTVKTSKTGRGGINLGESEEIINWFGHDVTDNGINRITTRIKFDKQFGGGGERLEHQLYETLEHGKGRTKHLETYAKRLPDGHVVDTRITGSGVNLDTLAADPYLFIRNYNNKDFAHSARWIAEKNQKVSELRGKFEVKPLGSDYGYYWPIKNQIVVDAVCPSVTKMDLVDTLNHEFRHKYQVTKGSQFTQRFLNLFRSKENKVPINESLMYAIRNRVSQFTTPFASITRKGYLNSFEEVDARKAGKFASDIYEFNTEVLAEIFGGPRRMYFGNAKLSDFLKNCFAEGQSIKVLDLGLMS